MMPFMKGGLPALPSLTGNLAAASSLGGKGAVLVRGFDFGTTAEQITAHMSNAGTVENVTWADIGAVCVQYSSAQEALAAVAGLQQTTIPGNSRYIDVIILDATTFLKGHDVDTDQATRFYNMPPEQQQAVMAKGSLATARDPTAVMVRRMKEVIMEASAKGFNPTGAEASEIAGGGAVLVRGFDFGTSDEQIAAHMATVGSIVSVKWVDEGSRCASYSSPEEAQAAVDQLQQTIIAGNSRYIDVILMDPNAFLAGHEIDTDKAMQFLAMTPQQQSVVMAKGSLATARDPTAVLIQRMKNAYAGAATPGAKGFAKGFLAKGAAITGNAGRAGTGSVMVRGFDFGTTDEQIAAHMATAGTVESISSIDGWCRCVTYGSTEEAKAAALHLNNSIIPGNSRYIDVLHMDPVAFVSEHEIDPAQKMQFLAMTPEHQHAVIAKGGLSTARDPTAVLIQRMKQVQGIGKGSFGPAAVGGKGGKGFGPYSGGKAGGMEKGGKDGKGGKMAILMKLVQMMSAMDGGE